MKKGIEVVEAEVEVVAEAEAVAEIEIEDEVVKGDHHLLVEEITSNQPMKRQKKLTRNNLHL